MVEVRFTLHALDEMESIADFIAKHSPRYASAFISKMFDNADVIKRHPRIGRMVPEIQDDTIRDLISGRYRIIYRIVSENRIDILTIHHSSREFPFSLFE